MEPPDGPTEDAFPRPDSREYDQRSLAEALCSTAAVINQSLNLNEVLKRILDVIGSVVPHDAANIMLVEDGAARMTAFRGYERLPSLDVAHMNWKIEDVPNLRHMVETGQPLVVPDTRSSPDWVNLETSFWIESYVSAPICHLGTTIGFLNLNSQYPGFYNANQAERLRAFADQAAIAIENARLYERAQAELAERGKAEEALQAALNELEQRVEIRTAELRETNEQLKLELSRRKQAEQRLEEERALLALRVEDRTAELSIANAELARASRMKDSFLASMSHELRTPLSVIINTAESLREGALGALNDEQDHSVLTIEQRGENLLHLINDILDLSKMLAGRLSLMMEDAPVESVCRSALDAVQNAIQKKSLKLAFQLDPQVNSVWADPRRLRQVLVSLLSNAVKFTPAGGEIGLSVTLDSIQKLVNLTVWDKGIGIRPEKIRQLFQPFIQLDDGLARQYEGPGLGLALVYSLVRLHDGSISVESQLGVGSRFTISLRWQEEVVDEVPSAQLRLETAPLPGEQENGLPDLIAHARRALNELHIETTGYWFEKESVQKALESGCNLFVLDVRLMTRSHELVALLRDAVQSVDIPIIMVTQAGMTERPTLPFGISFLPYPFSAEEVYNLIDAAGRGPTSLAYHAAIFLDRNDLAARQRPLVLVASDAPAGASLLSNFLDEAGFRVEYASNAIEAIERAREVPPELILLDAQIPGLELDEIMRRVRRSPLLKQTRLVVLTSLALPGDRDQCLRAGADTYLVRPVRLPTLAAVIHKLLPARR